MVKKLPDFSNECFFIAPIGTENSDERNRSDGVLNFIVTHAASELDLVAVRADQIANPGLIDLQVIEHLLHAKAAVADLTGMNPNVFYEMGVRHSFRLPLVIIAEKETVLPFDIAHMRTIFFDSNNLASSDRCREEIVNHLRQAIDNNIVDSPISTSMDISSLARGDVIGRSIADMVTTLEDVARSQRYISSNFESLKFNRVGSRSLVPQIAIADLIDKWKSVVAIAEDSENEELIEAVRALSLPIAHFQAALAGSQHIESLEGQGGSGFKLSPDILGQLIAREEFSDRERIRRRELLARVEVDKPVRPGPTSKSRKARPASS